MLRVEYAQTSDRTMKALTGLTRPAFRALVPLFSQALYAKAVDRDPPRQRRPGGGGKSTLSTVEAKLFFILMYVKCYPTFDVTAVLYGVNRSHTYRWTVHLLPVLEKALGQVVVLPERQIHSADAFWTRFPSARPCLSMAASAPRSGLKRLHSKKPTTRAKKATHP